MKYLSDSLDSYQQLESFIASGECGALLHEEKNSLFHSPEALESFEPIANEILRRLSIDGEYTSPLPEEIPTRYDNPFGYKILTGLIDTLKETCQELNIPTDEFPPYACIPTGVINAYAASVGEPATKFLLFDSQIFFFCNLLSKVVAISQPIINKDEMLQTSIEPALVREHLDEDDEPVRRLKELLEASIYESPSNAPAYLPKPPYIPLIDLLRDSMELFVVAHEFGHVYAGHLGPLLKAVSRTGDDLLEEATESQRIEYEADSIALVLTLQTMKKKGYDLALSYIGPYLFFSGLSLLDKYYEKREGVAAGAGSDEHPSHADRQAMLNHIVATLASEEQFNNAIHLQENFTTLVEELLSRIQVDG